jgi:hypothetical protein
MPNPSFDSHALQDQCTVIRMLLDLQSPSEALAQLRSFCNACAAPREAERLLGEMLAWGEQSGWKEDILQLPFSYEVGSAWLVAGVGWWYMKGAQAQGHEIVPCSIVIVCIRFCLD